MRGYRVALFAGICYRLGALSEVEKCLKRAHGSDRGGYVQYGGVVMHTSRTITSKWDTMQFTCFLHVCAKGRLKPPRHSGSFNRFDSRPILSYLIKSSNTYFIICIISINIIIIIYKKSLGIVLRMHLLS